MHLGPAGTDLAGASAWGGHKGESRALTWTGYPGLLVAAHQQQWDASIMLVRDKVSQYQASLVDGCLAQAGLIMRSA
jgi:hypothetical protein